MDDSSDLKIVFKDDNDSNDDTNKNLEREEDPDDISEDGTSSGSEEVVSVRMNQPAENSVEGTSLQISSPFSCLLHF